MCCFFPTSLRSWIKNPNPGGMPSTVKRLLAVFPLASSGLLTIELQAALSMPHFFSDHMVLQREREAAVWGQANPNASVTITFKGNTASAKAATQGLWLSSIQTSPRSNPRISIISTRPAKDAEACRDNSGEALPKPRNRVRRRSDRRVCSLLLGAAINAF